MEAKTTRGKLHLKKYQNVYMSRDRRRNFRKEMMSWNAIVNIMLNRDKELVWMRLVLTILPIQNVYLDFVIKGVAIIEFENLNGVK